MRKNVLVKFIRRNGGVEDAIEYSCRFDTKKWRCQGCDGIFRSRTYTQMDVSRVRRIFWSSRYEEIEV